MNLVDFLPEGVRVQRRQRKALLRQVVLAVFASMCLVVLLQIRHGQIATAQAELSLLDTKLAMVSAEASKRTELEFQISELLVKKDIDEQLGMRISVLDVMGELQRLTGPELTLTSLELVAMEVQDREAMVNLSRGPISAAEVAPQSTRRIKLVLTGVAPSDIAVASFIGKIAASPFFEKIGMGYSRNIEYQGCKAREFQVTMFVVR